MFALSCTKLLWGFTKRIAHIRSEKQALDLGFLWAAYHLVSGEDVGDQLETFLSIENGSDPRVGMALDWEKTRKGTASSDQIRDLVERFNRAMKPQYVDRYPILYGGSLIREDAAIQRGDALLAKCPLWYVRYTNGALAIPSATWPTYALWQFDDEKRRYGAPAPNVLPGADWNRFQGSEAELRAAWPFGGTTGAGLLQSILWMEAWLRP